MKRFVVVVSKEDFVGCIAIKDKYDDAVIAAYDYMNDYILDNTDDNTNPEAFITPLRELEGETGMFFTFQFNGDTTRVYILVNEE